MALSIEIPICPNQTFRLICFDDNLKFGEWVQTPQFHNNCEIGFFVSGNISTVVENNVYFLQSGNILTIAPNEMHMGKILKDGKFEYFQFDIPNELGNFLGEENVLLNCFLKRKIGEKNLINPSSAITEIIYEKLYKIKELILSETIDKKMLCFSYFIQIMSLVNEAFNNPAYISLNEIKKAPEILEKLVTIINSDYKTLYSVNDITVKANISKSYLTKLFKKYIGFTPYQFLLSKKISSAKLLLRNGANVTEACYQSGFNDYSYFISIFKQTEGLTPLKYKTKNLL